MPLGEAPGWGKRPEKCDISLEKMESDLIERTAHVLALQQLQLYVRLSLPSWGGC